MTVNYARLNIKGETWSIKLEVLPDGKNIRMMRISEWAHEFYTTEQYVGLVDSIAICEELQVLAKEQRGIFRLIALHYLKTEGLIYKCIEKYASEYNIAF